jgi:hypothetical protein
MKAVSVIPEEQVTSGNKKMLPVIKDGQRSLQPPESVITLKRGGVTVTLTYSVTDIDFNNWILAIRPYVI